MTIYTVYHLYCGGLIQGGYVGVTSRTLEERWRQHLSDARRGKTLLISAAIDVWGADSFSISQLAQYNNKEEAYFAERWWIWAKGTHEDKGGFNVNKGGEEKLIKIFERIRRKNI